MTWLCTLCLSMGVLLFLAACVFVAVRFVRMASDRDHAVGMHDTATPQREYRDSWNGRVLDERGVPLVELDELEDVPTPRERGRRT
jgi:hypothetical protein